MPPAKCNILYIYTEFRVAFGVVLDFGMLWTQRYLLTPQDKYRMMTISFLSWTHNSGSVSIQVKSHSAVKTEESQGKRHMM